MSKFSKFFPPPSRVDIGRNVPHLDGWSIFSIDNRAQNGHLMRRVSVIARILVSR